MALHHGIYTQRFRTYAELKDRIPNANDGVYALFPNGPGTAPSLAHCITVDGEHYQAVISQFGGPGYSRYGSNVSNSTLFGNRSTYDGIIQPFDQDGEMYSRVNNVGYNFWANQTGVKWFKRTRSYNASNTLVTNGAYSNDVFLEYSGGATFQSVWDTAIGPFTGSVSMKWRDYNGTLINYGSASHTTAGSQNWNSSRGFVNETDTEGQSTVMGNGSSYYSTAGWEARHVLSYVHTSAGSNATRCQFVCWGGNNEGMEQIWYAKFITE
jgi:hypothetical protein